MVNTNKNKVLRTLIVISIFIAIFGLFSISSSVKGDTINSFQGDILDFDGDIRGLYTLSNDIPVGDTFYLFDEAPGGFGGYWTDAEKSPTNTEDDLACWAATASNMMEWTGWGIVSGMDETDEFFAYYQDHTTDKGSLIEYGLEWWFTGYLNNRSDPTNWSTEDVPGGDFWSSSYTWTDYVLWHWNETTTLQKIDEWLNLGYSVGIAIYPITPPGGHAITVWGFEYDTAYNKNDPDEVHDYYLGIYVTDSDDNKGSTNPPNMLRYKEVNYDTTNNYWYLGGWKIGGVVALKPFPGETRPVADAGGAYVETEGTTVLFNASGSSDDDSLSYRWDFNGDHTWDTGWLASPTSTHTWYDDYSGDVYVEVFDGRLRDVDVTTVTITNEAPVITANGDIIDENEYAYVTGTIDDSMNDSFTMVIDWGDGTVTEEFSYPAGTESFNESHQYLDDNPTGTPYDNYTVTVTVTDDDGASNSTTTNVTVYNVNPIVAIEFIDQPNPQFILPNIHTLNITGNITDQGSLDTFLIEWNFSDGTIITGTLTPAHVFTTSGTYTINLTVTDDDTGVHWDTITVNVTDEHGALADINEYIQNLTADMFKGNSANRKKAFESMIFAIDDMLTDQEYTGAISDLLNNLKSKVNGDGKNDWITDVTAQYHLCMKIDDLIDYIEWLMM